MWEPEILTMHVAPSQLSTQQSGKAKDMRRKRQHQALVLGPGAGKALLRVPPGGRSRKAGRAHTLLPQAPLSSKVKKGVCKAAPRFRGPQDPSLSSLAFRHMTPAVGTPRTAGSPLCRGGVHGEGESEDVP